MIGNFDLKNKNAPEYYRIQIRNIQFLSDGQISDYRVSFYALKKSHPSKWPFDEGDGDGLG